MLEEDRRQGFDLTRAPLRLTLAWLGEGSYRFVWSHHHLLLDGWSLALVLKEVLVGYQALRTGGVASLPASRPYREYIAWLQGQDLAAAEAYWRRELAGFRAPTPLGVDRPAGGDRAEADGHGEERLRLTSAATAALQGWARRERLTLHTAVQGAWAVLLGRYSGQDDVVFGVTVSGRTAALSGVESMVGLFINTLPVRVRLSWREPAAAWLRGVQERQAEMRQHEHSPLVTVQAWSEVPRGRPLFESLLVFENYPADRAMGSGAGLEVSAGEVEAWERTNYPLTVIVVPGDELELRAGYQQDRLEGDAVRRLLGHLQTLLEGWAPAAESPPCGSCRCWGRTSGGTC